MERAEAKKIIQDLREKIHHHDYRYYVLDEPEIAAILGPSVHPSLNGHAKKAEPLSQATAAKMASS